MLLSIILLNYKKKTLTISCMDSLYEQFAQEFHADKMEVIIVDNNSQDDSVTSIREIIGKNNYKNARIISHSENGGFGAGCNVGAKAAKGEFVLFLNNDTVVKDKGILAMAKYLQEHPKIAILGGQLRNLDGTLQASSGKFYTLWYAFLLLLGGQKFGMLDKSPTAIQKVDWVKGALLMMRKDLFDKLGGFDEKIFMYIEDMELCYRAHLLGKEIYFYPDVQVVHEEHGSTSKIFAIVNIYKNLLYFYKKHRSLGEYGLLKFLLQTKAVLLIGIGSVLGKKDLVETYQKALEVI